MLALPLSLPLDNRLVILIGEGDVLVRKLKLIEMTPALILSFSGTDNDYPNAESLGKAALVIIAFDNKINAQDCLNQIRAINPKARYILNVVDQPDLSDVHIPAIIERGPLSIGIGTGGVTPTLARRLRARIEAILPEQFGRLAEACQKFATPIRAAEADPAKRRKLWERLLDGPWAKAVEINDLVAAETALSNALNDHNFQKGEVILMGAGPGSAGLLTLDGLRALIDADIIIYDRLVSDEVLALGRRDADYVYVGKQSAHHSLPQDEILSLLITEARQGRRVVRLKGGDPFVFGRGGEEIEGLRAAGIDVRIIAGITTAQALAASAQIALTHRSWAHGLSLLTAHAKDNQKGRSGLKADDFQNRGITKIIYMGIETAPDWVETAIKSGISLKSPILIGTNIAKDNQVLRLTTLGELVSALRLAPPDGPTVFILNGVMNGYPIHKEKALK